MYEIKLDDSGRNGIQAPGYFACSMNDVEVTRRDTFTSNHNSILLSGDGTCANGQGRFHLELGFDSRPRDQTWNIKNADGVIVADQKLTTAKNDKGGAEKEYYGDFAMSTLFFDKCLNPGRYTFNIFDSNGSDNQAPGYYKLFDNIQEVYASNGSFRNSETRSFSLSAAPEAPLTPAPGPVSFGCFSGSSSVEVMNQGSVALEDLKLGDMVHVGKEVYEPVYSFGHHAPDTRAEYLQVKTDKTILELSSDHMVFTASGSAIAARLLQIGDELLDANGDLLAIQSIEPVWADGVFAPFTPSGKIVVNDILVSSFVAFDSGSYLSVAGFKFSYQWMAHSFETPHRFYCKFISSCDNETYTADGISIWVDTPHKLVLWMFEQPWVVQSLMGGVVVALFVMFSLIDICILIALAVAVGALTAWKIVGRYKKL